MTQEIDYDKLWKKMEKCPICGEQYEYTCKCQRSDRGCKNGHNWHLCTEHKKIITGASDHGKHGCSCATDRKYRTITICEEDILNLKACLETTKDSWEFGFDLWPFTIQNIIKEWEGKA
jgi:hypothetical protein